jgi:hypothetical protein
VAEIPPWKKGGEGGCINSFSINLSAASISFVFHHEKNKKHQDLSVKLCCHDSFYQTFGGLRSEYGHAVRMVETIFLGTMG